MRLGKLATGLGALVVVATAVPAFAQSSAQPSGGTSSHGYPPACAAETVPKGQSDKAHDIYRAGKVQYDDNNHDAALALFKDAYNRDCSKHDLLIIISRAYELKGDRVEAVRALELFLERDPKNADADSYRRRIAKLKEQIAAQPPPTATAPATGTAAPSATSTTSPSSTEVREHTIPPWIVFGVGAAAMIAGVVVVATAPALPAFCNASNESCEQQPNESDAAFKRRQDEAGRSKGQPVAGAIVIGAGGVLVLGGLLWHFLEPTGPETAAKNKPKLTPSVSPGFTGLSFGGNF